LVIDIGYTTTGFLARQTSFSRLVGRRSSSMGVSGIGIQDADTLTRRNRALISGWPSLSET